VAEQLAAIAIEQGARVMRGGCVPLGEEGVPFAPVIEALRGLALAIWVGSVLRPTARLAGSPAGSFTKIRNVRIEMTTSTTTE
jgi:hypothetical protein